MPDRPLIKESGFDPLREFYGMWNTRLAERYLPLPRGLFSKYECVDGRLVPSPAWPASNGYAAVQLSSLLGPPAEAAGFFVYGRGRLAFNPGTWIVPDLAV